ncbi:hypothetical protein MHBO_000940 [Bonamia ostreae]|uniref:Uncharacterized protein n=1 Tax=Bonamia ostreae TaxID=126728 RepID=A0ABV2AHB6_9EUKA
MKLLDYLDNDNFSCLGDINEAISKGSFIFLCEHCTDFKSCKGRQCAKKRKKYQSIKENYIKMAIFKRRRILANPNLLDFLKTGRIPGPPLSFALKPKICKIFDVERDKEMPSLEEIHIFVTSVMTK